MCCIYIYIKGETATSASYAGRGGDAPTGQAGRGNDGWGAGSATIAPFETQNEATGASCRVADLELQHKIIYGIFCFRNFI